MCPDRQIISLYVDEELPSPWKEKLETHLESCPECRVILSGYQNLRENLRRLPEKTLWAAEDRVWRKLTTPELVISRGASPKKSFWNRSITLPLPVTAAAAVIIIAFFALMGMRNGERSVPQETIVTASIGFDDYGFLSIQDMNGVLQYLASQDTDDDMIIRLPENRRFSRSGEPALINAVEYSRRSASR